jgi:hypothetical protein
MDPFPGIKNSMYNTDECQMYSFKVRFCSTSCDWTKCPFVHPGENARRRDPWKYHYTFVPCLKFWKETCRTWWSVWVCTWQRWNKLHKKRSGSTLFRSENTRVMVDDWMVI